MKRKGEARRRRKKKTLIPMAEMSKRTKESVLVLPGGGVGVGRTRPRTTLVEFSFFTERMPWPFFIHV